MGLASKCSWLDTEVSALLPLLQPELGPRWAREARALLGGKSLSQVSGSSYLQGAQTGALSPRPDWRGSFKLLSKQLTDSSAITPWKDLKPLL